MPGGSSLSPPPTRSAPRPSISSKCGARASARRSSPKRSAPTRPASPIEALERARAEGMDVLLIDTAGRLQNKSDLMAELAKIVRVLKKLDATAPHGVILVLDATTGQNALAQVEIFKEIAGVTGAGRDQARRHGAGRHPGRHRRALQAADQRHRRRRGARRSQAVRCATTSPAPSPEQRARMKKPPERKVRCAGGRRGRAAGAPAQARHRARAAAGVFRRQRHRRHLCRHRRLHGGDGDLARASPGSAITRSR